MKEYDVIVIGSGGGTKISTPAAKLGKKAAIIEKSALGGTCLNRGCIPSKMLIYPANVATMINDTKKFDMKASIDSINFGKIVRRISNTVDGQSDGIKNSYKKKKIKNLDFYEGHGRFVTDNIVEVNGKKIKGKKIVIATGAKPLIPNIPGLEGTPYMTSTEALRETKLPDKLIVIGGGYIACELGHAYGALGSKVTVLARSGLLKREDKAIRTQFEEHFSKKYKVERLSPIKVEYKDKKFKVTAEDKKGSKKTFTADALLMATGVMPNTDNLGLENTNIKTDKNGYIKVDRYLHTTSPGVYAIGDCVGNYMFRHSVNFEGEYLFNQLFHAKKRSPIKYPPMPHAVFSYPEIAGVGKTEDELIAEGKEDGVDYIEASNAYEKSAMGMARLSDHGFVKLLFDIKTKRLIGAHIIGDEAATMIHQAIYAMTFKGTVDDLLNIIYIHPALPEVFRNAVRNAKAQFDQL